MDLKTQDIKTLKSLAYDQLALIESCQNNLKALNQELASRQPNSTSTPKVKPKREKSEWEDKPVEEKEEKNK